jgi:hypothetical protein
MELCASMCKKPQVLLLNMPPFTLPAKQTRQKRRKINRAGRISEMNTSSNWEPQENRGGETRSRTWSNAQPREWWPAAGGVADLALRRRSRCRTARRHHHQSPCGGRRTTTNSRSLAARPHQPAPPTGRLTGSAPLPPNTPSRFFNRSWRPCCVFVRRGGVVVPQVGGRGMD